ncbi:hypothetical protein BC831DRAFT_512521 [Entophlyctis helioformis]|nr:hypothetical protein BC831DRAFT_512521 [Entophlyctis helioformis]
MPTTGSSISIRSTKSITKSSSTFDLELYLKRQELAAIKEEMDRTERVLGIIRDLLLSGGEDMPRTRQHHQELQADDEYAEPRTRQRKPIVSLPPRSTATSSSTKRPTLIERREDGVYVKIVCSGCKRSDFSSMQGFINHSKAVHKIQYLSHLDAAASRLDGIGVSASAVVAAARDEAAEEAERQIIAKILPTIKVHDTEVLDLADFDAPSPVAIDPIALSPLSDDGSDHKMAEHDEQDGEQDDEQDDEQAVRESRFHTTREFLVGNVSKYLSSNHAVPAPDGKPKYEYKWMVYLIDPNDTANVGIGRLIRKVRFYLHPDYFPYTVVDVSTPPFQLARYGWGECPVRLQIFFWDSSAKPVSIIHMLKLDFFRTGREIKGAERKLEIELDRNIKLREAHENHGAEMDEEDDDNDVPETKVLNDEIVALLDKACKQFPILRKATVPASHYAYRTATTYAEFMSWPMGTPTIQAPFDSATLFAFPSPPASLPDTNGNESSLASVPALSPSLESAIRAIDDSSVAADQLVHPLEKRWLLSNIQRLPAHRWWSPQQVQSGRPPSIRPLPSSLYLVHLATNAFLRDLLGGSIDAFRESQVQSASRQGSAAATAASDPAPIENPGSIVRAALAKVNADTSKPPKALLVPMHVCKAILANPRLAFLTNEGMLEPSGDAAFAGPEPDLNDLDSDLE